MIKLKKSFFPLLAVPFIFIACMGEPTDLVDASLESVFPQDTSMVFVIDHSDSEQIGYFEDLMDKFPETELKKKIIAEIDGGLEEDDLNYEDDLEPIFEGDWRVGFSMTFPEDVSFDEDFDIDAMELYLVAEFEEADDFENFLNDGKGDSVEYTKDGAIKYWTDEKEDIYVARYGNVYFLTNTAGNRKAAIKRIEDGTGLTKNEDLPANLDALAEHNLGYFYFNGDMFGGAFAGLYEEMGMADFNKYLAGLGNMYAVWTAEADGILIVSRAEISDESSLDKYGLVPDFEPVLINSVNGNGMIAYAEQGSAGTYIEAFLDGFSMGYNSVNSGFSGGFDPGLLETSILDSEVEADPALEAMPDGLDIYQDMLDQLQAMSGLAVEEVTGVLDSPFAFAMSDIGGFYPTISLYLKIADEHVDNAKKLASAVDEYANDLILEFDDLMVSMGEDAGLLKKDVDAVGGGALHKLYLDFDASENAQISLGMMGLTPEDVAVELYYGLTGDNVFVFALYPGFAEDYGKNVLAENEDFREGVAKLGDGYGYMISYFAPGPLVDIATKYVDLYGASGLIPAEFIELYDLYGKKFVPTFKYFISSAVVDDSVLRSDMYVRIEEVAGE